MQFFRIAQALEGLRNDMDKNSPIDPVQKIQFNEFICEKLAMAYDALSDAALTKQASFKPNPQEYNGVATKLCTYMRNNGVGSQYLIGGVLLESQLAIYKICTFINPYIVNNRTPRKPSSRTKLR